MNSAMCKLMTKCKTTVSMTPRKKDYKPAGCLCMMWKVITAPMSEELYKSFIYHGVFPEGNKKCCKAKRGMNDLQCTDHHILKYIQTREKMLARHGMA